MRLLSSDPPYPAGRERGRANRKCPRVSERLKVTSIAVTHDTRSMRRIGKRILYMRNGKIYVDGTPEEIFSSTDPVVHRFVNGIADLKEHDF